MTGHAMTATDAGGERLAEPTLGEAAEFGARHRTDYVSVRHGHDSTLSGTDATGALSVLVVDAPAAVVVEIRRRHDALRRPEPGWARDPHDGNPFAHAHAAIERMCMPCQGNAGAHHTTPRGSLTWRPRPVPDR
ncbi:hypothetical protein ACFYWP_34360 [Actinacidiphila glaucinigra]|uniref:hypothetical protein n=1 Tax=Actinacidiphila glaucinigra TaxID=235986 RepID=UPI00368F4BD1